jgi:NADPH:quinone reductase-like Zn-dependent oxidoreductase
MVMGAANAQADLAVAAELGAAGAYRPRVQATYPLEKAADAHAHAQGGHTRGKVVITL